MARSHRCLFQLHSNRLDIRRSDLWEFTTAIET